MPLVGTARIQLVYLMSFCVNVFRYKCKHLILCTENTKLKTFSKQEQEHYFFDKINKTNKNLILGYPYGYVV